MQINMHMHTYEQTKLQVSTGDWHGKAKGKYQFTILSAQAFLLTVIPTAGQVNFYIHLYVSIYICMYMYIYVYVYRYRHKYIHIHIFIYMYESKYSYIYIYVYIYM